MGISPEYLRQRIASMEKVEGEFLANANAAHGALVMLKELLIQLETKESVGNNGQDQKGTDLSAGGPQS